MNKTTYVYRAYSEDNQLCYVGITNSIDIRINAHRKEKPWWIEVSYLVVKEFDLRKHAEEEEFKAIQLEFPKYNEIPGKSSPSSVALNEYADRLGPPKTRKKLPKDEINYLMSLEPPKVYERAKALASVGWPVTSIMEGVRIKPAAPDIRRNIKLAIQEDNSKEIPLPDLTRKEKSALKRAQEVHLSTGETRRLQFLAKKVKNYRPGHLEGHPIYEAKEEYNHLIKTLYEKGVKVSEMANAVGVDESNIRRRLRL